MTNKNKYAKHSHIPEYQIRQIVRLVSVDLEATHIAKLTGLNRNTINRYLKGIWQHLVEYCDVKSPFSCEIEVDESFFEERFTKGKRGRGSFGKTIVFGIFQRNGHVHTEIVPDYKKSTLQRAVRERVDFESIIYFDGWRGYNGLVDVGFGIYLRVDHGRDEFVTGRTHINGIEGFWGFTKTRLARFRGMRPETFNCICKSMILGSTIEGRISTN
jgi:transposase-like protein